MVNPLRRLVRTPAGAALRASWVTERKFGHWRSVREHASVDRSGRPIPWFTDPATRWLEQLDLSGAAVLEFGSGNSTRWWAERVRHVVAIEDDPRWYERLADDLPAAVDCRLADGEAEHIAAAGTDTFDIVVVDGNYRPACARVAVDSLRAGGFIVFDNADWYPRATSFLRGAGLAQVDFVGLGPINPYPWATSVFLDVRGGFRFTHTAEINIPGHRGAHAPGDR